MTGISTAGGSRFDMTVALAIVDGANWRPVCERCVVAERVLPRMKGLLGSNGLEAGEGLLLRPAPSIHTWFMRFTIDAVFLDADMSVLRVVHEMRPWRMASQRGARVVLELSAGEAARRGIRAGQTVQFANGDIGPDVTVAVSQPFEPQREIHTLVVSRDLAFRGHALAALARIGPVSFALADPGDSDDVVELVRQERSDVVVLDVTASLSAAPGTLADLQVMASTLGVVVVSEPGDRDDPPPRGLHALRKWTSAEELSEAVERAYGQIRSLRRRQPAQD